MRGGAEAVLERHLKKAHHLRHFNNVGGPHVEAPNLDPKRGPIPGRKDLTIQGFDPTGAHGLSVLYGMYFPIFLSYNCHVLYFPMIFIYFIYHIFISYNLIFISCHLLVTSYILLTYIFMYFIRLSYLMTYTYTFLYIFFHILLYFYILSILFMSSSFML